MKRPKERDEERRNQKLAAIQEQIDQGTLTVRKMTAKERKQNPPRSDGGSRKRP